MGVASLRSREWQRDTVLAPASLCRSAKHDLGRIGIGLASDSLAVVTWWEEVEDSFLSDVATSRLLLIRWGRGLPFDRVRPHFSSTAIGSEVSDVALPFGVPQACRTISYSPVSAYPLRNISFETRYGRSSSFLNSRTAGQGGLHASLRSPASLSLGVMPRQIPTKSTLRQVSHMTPICTAMGVDCDMNTADGTYGKSARI